MTNRYLKTDDIKTIITDYIESINGLNPFVPSV